MRKLFVLFVLAMLTVSVSAQKEKLSPQARILITKQKAEHASLAKAKSQKAMPKERSVLSVLCLNKGGQLPDDSLYALGATVTKRCGNMIFARVPVSKLVEVAGLKAVKTVETGRKMRLNNDKSREASSVVFIHERDFVPTKTSLPTVKECKHRGEGVLACIIDSEIDFTHPAFYDAKGASRLREALVTDIDDDGNIIFHTYYSPDDAEEKMSDYEVALGHGTHVAGIMAGCTDSFADDDAMKKYYGMAPEAQLLLYDTRTLYDTELLEMLAYAFEKSNKSGEPLVVNMSIGSNSSRLDGTDFFVSRLNEMCEEYGKEGKIVCVSAGNEGEYDMSVQIECDKPIQNNDWTLQKKVALELEKEWDSEERRTKYTIDCYHDFYARDGKEYAVKYSIYEYDPAGGIYKYVDESQLLTREDLETTEDLDISFDLLSDSGNKILLDIIPECEVTETGGYYFFGDVGGDCTKQTLVVASIYTKEEGVTVDGAVNNGQFATVDNEDYANANSYGSFNVMASTDNVISVGSYNTRIGYTDIKGRKQKYFSHYKDDEVGDINLFSSYQTDHYGAIKPDVLAPGTEIISSYHHSYNDEITTVGYSRRNGTSYPWGVICGTSMACPAVSGIIALWLQADPLLTVDEVRTIIKETSTFDSYCEKRKEKAGYGKINALRGLERVIAAAGIKDIQEEDDILIHPKKYLTPDHRLLLEKDGLFYNAAGARVR